MTILAASSGMSSKLGIDDTSSTGKDRVGEGGESIASGMEEGGPA